MPSAARALTCSFVSSVDRILREDWNRLFGEVAEGYDFFRVLERSRLEGFEFGHALVHDGDRLCLIAPLFWSDFDLGIGAEGFGRRLLDGLRRRFPRLLVERTLFCGSPFGEHGALGVAADGPGPEALLAVLVRSMERFCRERGLTCMLFKDFPAGDHGLLAPLGRLGFLRGESLPNVVLPLPFATMDDYLASLGRHTRKDLRRKVRRAEAAGAITVEVVPRVDERIEPVYRLYLNTYEAGTTRFEKLSREYFLAVGREMGGQALFFLYHHDGRLVAFNLCFRHGDQLIDKFIGLDYAVARRLNLYFYSWHTTVRWCLAHGIRAYQVGQTDTEAKVYLGGRRVPLYFHLRFINPFMNVLLRLAGRFFAPPPTSGAVADTPAVA